MEGGREGERDGGRERATCKVSEEIIFLTVTSGCKHWVKESVAIVMKSMSASCLMAAGSGSSWCLK